jgi:hypothetical protein
MRDLQSTIQLHGVSVEQFLDYKQLLIDYLERFMGDLVLATNEIGQKILLLEQLGMREQFRSVAQRALVDALTPRVGRDTISDFVTNLTKEYLLEFTQQFAKQHISAGLRKECSVHKVSFNYDTRSREPRLFDLPWDIR